MTKTLFNKFTCVIAFILLLTLSCWTALPQSNGYETKKIDIFSFNDFHGRVDDNTYLFDTKLLEEITASKRDGHKILLISGGDNIGASSYTSFVQNDIPTIDFLNDLKKATGAEFISTIGNHEFDKGADSFSDVLNGTGFATGHQAEFTYISANIKCTDTTSQVACQGKNIGDDAFLPYTITDIDGLKIGFVGATTQDTPSAVSPAGVKGLEFTDPVDAVNNVISVVDATAEKPNFWIAIYHEGASVSEPDYSLKDATAFSPRFAKIVSETLPAVKEIITAHTHQIYSYDDTTRPIVQAGNYGSGFTKSQINYSKDGDQATLNGEITASYIAKYASGNRQWFLTNTDALSYTDVTGFKLSYSDFEGGTYTSSDGNGPCYNFNDTNNSDDAGPTGACGVVTTARQYADKQGSVVIGSAETDITRGYLNGEKKDDDRSIESALGTLIGQSTKDYLSAHNHPVDIGMINAGGIRADILNGNIDVKTANSVLPYANELFTVKVTGAVLKNILEEQWQPGTPSRPILTLGMSHNIKYTVDNQNISGASRTYNHVKNIWVNGKLVSPNDTFTIGTINFLAQQGGDNFTSFLQGTNLTDTGIVDRDYWFDYIENHSPLAADYQKNRIIASGVPTTIKLGSKYNVKFSGLIEQQKNGSYATSSVQVKLDGKTNQLSYNATADNAGNVSITGLQATKLLKYGKHTLSFTFAPYGEVLNYTVTIAAPNVSKYSPAKKTITVKKGKTKSITVKATATAGITGAVLKFKKSNSKYAKITLPKTIKSGKKFTLKVKGLKKGKKKTIYIKSSNGKKFSIKVTVK